MNDSDEESHDISKEAYENDGYASETDDDNQRYDDDQDGDLDDVRDEFHDDSTSSERYYSDTELDSTGWKIGFSYPTHLIYNIALTPFSCEIFLFF